jgi:PAS domain S-box-containing protein
MTHPLDAERPSERPGAGPAAAGAVLGASAEDAWGVLDGTDLHARDILRATLESTADGILVVGTGGETLFFNRRFAELWKIPDDLLQTRSDDRLLAYVLDQLVDPDGFLTRVRAVYAGDDESFDTLRFKDGRVFERYSRPLVTDGQGVGRVWSFRDVTDRLVADDQRREAEAKYRSLVEAIPAITYIDDWAGDGNAYISPQTEWILGYTQQDWAADPELMSKLIHPEDREAWEAENTRFSQTGTASLIEYRVLARDGRVVWIRDAAVLVRDAEGRAQFSQGVMFDITQSKEAERQLESALRRETEAAGQLRELDEMKNTFLQAVSHELRTPLTAILGAALTLERHDVELAPDVARDLVSRLASNARKLNRLLSDLLDIDRLARGIIEPKREPIDVGALTRALVEESDIARDREVQIDAGQVMAEVDGPKVERIVENLLANTLRHTPAGTPVWVRVAAHPEGVLIVVDDAGPGIPAELRETVFEPFRQIPGLHPYAPGVGIGLSLVARFAELHGGRAWVEERPGGGASFRVLLRNPT